MGVLSLTEDAMEGYTFFSPFSGTKAYMIDNCGNLINEWDRGTRPGLSAYFLENGLMMRTYKVSPIGQFTSASNAGGIELVDWDNNLVWKYEINTSEQLSHHDAVMMPNGNILVLTWEMTYREELIELGRNPNEIAPQNFMWSEKILELEPIGENDAKIVWQWHINDHYIQDFDASKTGFGVVSEHPELFDINQPEIGSINSNSSRDWTHMNAIDYNEELDQILISVRNTDEVWILDHSTTTEEAATHAGGRYGKGGDILYRWGNPSAYQRGLVGDQLLWGQHGTNWIKSGLANEGALLIYNNGNGKPGTDFSQAQILFPPQDSLGFYSSNDTDPFGPPSANTIYGDLNSESFYSPFLSNAQQLENGNTLINAGSPGLIFEVTPDREVVWAYKIPLFGDVPATQGQNVSSNGNFRAYKFPVDFSGFDDINITPGLPIELNPTPCNIMTSIDLEEESAFNFIFRSETNSIDLTGEVHMIESIALYDQQGKVIQRFSSPDKELKLKDAVLFGLFFLAVEVENGKQITTSIFLY